VGLRELKRRPLDCFRDFYADTATFGSAAAVRCALDFYGADHQGGGGDGHHDFAPVSMAAWGTLMLVAHPKAGLRSAAGVK
jgi:hypothetical protein